MVSMSDGSMARSSRASTRRRGLLLAIVLGAALQLAHAPQAFAAIAFVKNVGFLADNITGTTTSVTVPAGGVAFGHTVLVSLAIDPVAGAVSCTDTQGNSYSAVIDFSNGSGTTGLAASTSLVLKNQGYTMNAPDDLRSNGARITTPTTTIYYRADSLPEAQAIMHKYFPSAQVLPAPAGYPADVQVTIVLGTDFAGIAPSP